MVSSGGGGTPRQPNMPTPAGAGSIPYGEATPFTPSYTSVLGAGWTTPEMVDAGVARGLQEQAARPQPAPFAGINPAMMGEFETMRNQLAAMQARQKMEAENRRKYAFSLTNTANGGVGGRSSSSGHSGSARGGAGGGSSARR
jgi:hypothetical protein